MSSRRVEEHEYDMGATYEGDYEPTGHYESTAAPLASSMAGTISNSSTGYLAVGEVEVTNPTYDMAQNNNHNPFDDHIYDEGTADNNPNALDPRKDTVWEMPIYDNNTWASRSRTASLPVHVSFFFFFFICDCSASQ